MTTVFGVRCSMISMIAIVPYQLPSVTYEGDYNPSLSRWTCSKKNWIMWKFSQQTLMEKFVDGGGGYC